MGSETQVLELVLKVFLNLLFLFSFLFFNGLGIPLNFESVKIQKRETVVSLLARKESTCISWIQIVSTLWQAMRFANLIALQLIVPQHWIEEWKVKDQRILLQYHCKSGSRLFRFSLLLWFLQKINHRMENNNAAPLMKFDIDYVEALPTTSP